MEIAGEDLDKTELASLQGLVTALRMRYGLQNALGTFLQDMNVILALVNGNLH